MSVLDSGVSDKRIIVMDSKMTHLLADNIGIAFSSASRLLDS